VHLLGQSEPVDSCRVEVEYGPDAKAQLRDLGWAVGHILDQELKTLADTRSVDDFRPLDVPHDPPWWRVDLNDAYAAVVRSCSPAELMEKGVRGPRLVVSHVVARDELDAVVRKMIDEPEDIDGQGAEE
jgi:hypothetical protein